jgi:hypothetical protein
VGQDRAARRHQVASCRAVWRLKIPALPLARAPTGLTHPRLSTVHVLAQYSALGTRNSLRPRRIYTFAPPVQSLRLGDHLVTNPNERHSIASFFQLHRVDTTILSAPRRS